MCFLYFVLFLRFQKERDPLWAKSIQESSERRSDLTQRLVNAARRLEKQYGRQRIKARVEAIPKFNIPSFKGEQLRNRLQISLLILSNIKRISSLLFP